MTDYTNLVKALRCRDAEFGYYRKCKYYGEASDNRCVLCDSDRLANDAAAAIEDLQAVLKEADKKQAYQHDYICELVAENEELKAEAKQSELKRGEWIYEDLDNFRKYKVTCPHCGKWFVGNYDAYDEPSDFLYCPHCGNICNPTNLDWENELKEREKESRAKMEVQE